MRIAIAADHAGYEFKELLRRGLEALGHDVLDLGTRDPTQPDDYPDFAAVVGRAVQSQQVERGVLVLGSRVIGAALAHDLVAAFLRARFTGEEWHVRRRAKVRALEEERCRA